MIYRLILLNNNYNIKNYIEIRQIEHIFYKQVLEQVKVHYLLTNFYKALMEKK